MDKLNKDINKLITDADKGYGDFSNQVIVFHYAFNTIVGTEKLKKLRDKIAPNLKDLSSLKAAAELIAALNGAGAAELTA